MGKQTFDSWAQEVVHLLRCVDRISEPHAINEHDADFLSRCHSGIAEDAWASGVSAVNYAAIVCESVEGKLVELLPA